VPTTVRLRQELRLMGRIATLERVDITRIHPAIEAHEVVAYPLVLLLMQNKPPEQLRGPMRIA
jgi:hypothetical protein